MRCKDTIRYQKTPDGEIRRVFFFRSVFSDFKASPDAMDLDHVGVAFDSERDSGDDNDDVP